MGLGSGWRSACWLLLGAALSGCDGGGESAADSEKAETDCTEEDAAYDLTWDNWGQSFFAAYCDACHAASSPNRFGAPEGISFDSAAEVRTWASAIEVAVLEEQSMPLGGGVAEEDLLLLGVYLRCGP